MLRHPTTEVNLLNIASESGEAWRQMSAALRHGAKVGGALSKSFSDSCIVLRNIEEHQQLSDLINKPIMIRACIYLWLEEEEFIKSNRVDHTTLQKFNRIKPQIGFINLFNLIQIFFKHYDHCGDLDSLSNFLLKQLSQLNDKTAVGVVSSLNVNRDRIFHGKGHIRVVEKAETDGTKLSDTMKELGIDETYEGRFKELAVGFYYIKKLNALDPNLSAEQSILDEVSAVDVPEIPYEGRLLGHSAIEALVNNAVGRRIELPEHWLQTILSIAGDPRIPRTDERYRKWWAQIPSQIINLVYERLSGFDLKLFLEVLENFAARSGDDALARMFPKRRLFLEGLLKQNLIRRSRLFISREAHYYLNRNYKQEMLPNYARLNDRNTSIIYLKLNRSHIVEGSHNHRFWIYTEIPENSAPNNYERSDFKKRELYDMNKWNVASSNGNTWSTYHNGFWQGKVLEQFRKLGIKVDPEQVLEKSDYRRFRYEYGIRR